MNKECEYDFLHHYNRLVHAWLQGELSLEYLKSVKRIFERVLLYFPLESDRDLLFSSLEHFTLDLSINIFSDSQMKSKKWIVETLKKEKITSLGNIYILGGWCGLVNRFIKSESELCLNSVYSFDLNKEIQEYSDLLNSPEFKLKKYKAVIKDVNELNYTEDSIEVHEGQMVTTKCNTVINTSCEHMGTNWLENTPSGTLVIAQSNDDTSIEDHKFCSKGLEDFKSRLGLEQILFSGELIFPKYKRFMVIGYK